MTNTRKKNITTMVLELFILIVAFIYLLPIWIVLINSFKTSDAANQFGLGIPNIFHFENYVQVFQQADALRGLFNGFFIASVVGVAAVLFSAMASFFISRSNTRFAKFSFNYFVSGLIIPVAIVPTYFSLLILHLNNTYLGLIMVFVTYTLPLSVFLFTGFIKTIPRELDEAAIVDGCNGFRMFASVIFPLLAPVTVTVIVFNFIGVWNEVQVFLFFAAGEKWPLSLSVYSFFGKYNQNWNLVFADILIAIIPCLLLYVLGQKYVVAGMTAGAVKG